MIYNWTILRKKISRWNINNKLFIRSYYFENFNIIGVYLFEAIS